MPSLVGLQTVGKDFHLVGPFLCHKRQDLPYGEANGDAGRRWRLQETFCKGRTTMTNVSRRLPGRRIWVPTLLGICVLFALAFAPLGARADDGPVMRAKEKIEVN